MSTSVERTALLVIKGAISELTLEEQGEVKKCTEAIRALIAEHGDAAQAAVMMTGLEIAIEAQGEKT